MLCLNIGSAAHIQIAGLKQSDIVDGSELSSCALFPSASVGQTKEAVLRNVVQGYSVNTPPQFFSLQSMTAHHSAWAEATIVCCDSRTLQVTLKRGRVDKETHRHDLIVGATLDRFAVQSYQQGVSRL